MNKRCITIIICLAIILLAACAPSPQAIQTAIAKTQAAWTPTPTSTFTPEPTATVHPPSFAAILGSNGFVLEPLYEDNCASPCTSYEHMKPWVVATVFDNGGFEIFGSKSDVQFIYPIITQLYGQDITDWIANHLAILLRESIEQTGSISGYDIQMSEMDNGNRVWITITSKG